MATSCFRTGPHQWARSTPSEGGAGLRGRAGGPGELFRGPWVAAALLAAGLGTGPAVQAGSLRLGAPAPPAVLTTLDGRRLSTADLRGNVVILTFWATWCVPCRDELPLLSDYARAHAGQGLAVLGFSLDDPADLDKVRAVARTLDFPVGLLGSDRLGGYGRIWHIPVNFTIDRQGRLADDGWRDKQPVWTRERLESVVTPLLAAP